MSMSEMSSMVAARWRMAKRLVRSRMPEAITSRIGPATARYRPQDVPAPVAAPATDVRLLVGPRNFAGQGDRWARAAERLPGVGAVSMIAGDNGGLDFPVDYGVPDAVYTNSRRWGIRQRGAVGAGFTHVMIEAVSSMFGAASDKVVAREVEWLRAQGVQVAMLCHGTDIRLPDRHAQLDEWSPFRDAPADWVNRLQTRASFNQQVLDRVAAPVFVSTPEMLLDRPGAQWLPIVVDIERWATSTEILTSDRPVVLHAPTNPLVKGTALIEPIVQRLHEARQIDYRRVVRVPSGEMPALYAGADVVLEQFALGMYSVTSVEAMAAGRIAIAHVHDQVRDHVRETTGLELPVVEATPDTLHDVLDDIRTRPEHYREVARRGPDFVRAVHDGALSARVLAPFLGVTA
ncbi:hypothetical protein PTQ19_05070 [Microbacterium esteraromaticum]|uniref:hypothetical protein n=1 Tax=Microbacterium esteraromaticum TaxID=57043 RepID=UPI00236777C8|nr:hypothetical protein [Microbacterium esteraromaticum]WDH79813.1 hypothetical protein PTQ19_05070 [Microbacterium esteraromaticum]